jgi:hypothetical protein
MVTRHGDLLNDGFGTASTDLGRRETWVTTLNITDIRWKKDSRRGSTIWVK